MVSLICFKDRLSSHTKNSSRTWQRFESTEAGKQRGPSGSGEATGSEARELLTASLSSQGQLPGTKRQRQEPSTPGHVETVTPELPLLLQVHGGHSLYCFCVLGFRSSQQPMTAHRQHTELKAVQQNYGRGQGQTLLYYTWNLGKLRWVCKLHMSSDGNLKPQRVAS